MPLLRSSTRPTPVQCFFCLSTSLLPPSASNDRKGKSRISEIGTKWNWQCDRCGCWNIRDEKGEMISDLPAMHDVTFNENSFNLRAKPSSSHLPSSSSSSSKSTFCHNCLSNQTLIMNMLANYLPDDDDPSYTQLYSELPNYLTTLHSRYPPVCRDCQPAVDEALRKSDHRAQVQAWSSALDRGARIQGHGSTGVKRGMGLGEVFMWRVRGVLWWVGIGLSLGQGVLATAFPSQLQRKLDVIPPNLPTKPMALLLFHALSFAWITWDPYWLQRIRNRDKIKVEGRDTWVRNMMLIALVRVIGSTASCFITDHSGLSFLPLKTIQAAFAMEIALLIHSLMNIRISQPVSIKLVRPVSLTSPPSNLPNYNIPTHPSSGISSLSLSNLHPSGTYTKSSPNPIFGKPSLQQPLPELPVEGEPMDWEPTLAQQRNTLPLLSPEDDDVEMNFQTQNEKQKQKQDWDKFALGKQRMFHNQNETGLENLLAGWGIGGNVSNINNGVNGSNTVNGVSSSSDNKTKQKLHIINQNKSINIEIIVKALGISLIFFRIIGSTLLFTLFKSSKMTNIQILNRWLLIIEALNTTLQCFIYFQRNSYTSISLATKISWSIFDFIIRHIMLISPISNTLINFDMNEGSKQGLEWMGWGGADLISLWVG